MSEANRKVRIKVSPRVARAVAGDAPRELKMQAARGELGLAGRDLLASLFFLCHGGDREIRKAALRTVRDLSTATLAPLAGDAALQPQLLDFIARARRQDRSVIESLLANPSLPEATVLYLAQEGEQDVLDTLAGNDELLQANPRLVEAMLANPHLSDALKARLGAASKDGEAADGEEAEEAAAGEEDIIEDDENLSKYQMALEMGVSEKIKMAMTGDKEWRSIFLKDSNKMVSSAALKNPRITEGEVLALAKNKSSNDELIRMITMNREWVKNFEIKKALVYHPKTPLPKALRYMNFFGEKDLKTLAKSRGVSQVLVNNARRMLIAKEKK